MTSVKQNQNFWPLQSLFLLPADRHTEKQMYFHMLHKPYIMSGMPVFWLICQENADIPHNLYLLILLYYLLRPESFRISNPQKWRFHTCWKPFPVLYGKQLIFFLPAWKACKADNDMHFLIRFHILSSRHADLKILPAVLALMSANRYQKMLLLRNRLLKDSVPVPWNLLLLDLQYLLNSSDGHRHKHGWPVPRFL